MARTSPRDMKVRLGELKRVIRQVLGEDPRPTTMELGEVDTDPNNNPGRPTDAFDDYIGMHPKPEATMVSTHSAAAVDPTHPSLPTSPKKAREKFARPGHG